MAYFKGYLAVFMIVSASINGYFNVPQNPQNTCIKSTPKFYSSRCRPPKTGNGGSRLYESFQP